MIAPAEGQSSDEKLGQLKGIPLWELRGTQLLSYSAFLAFLVMSMGL